MAEPKLPKTVYVATNENRDEGDDLVVEAKPEDLLAYPKQSMRVGVYGLVGTIVVASVIQIVPNYKSVIARKKTNV